MPALPMVIDTDTGSDDAVALLLAAACGLADVRAVTTVAGNVPLTTGTRNALISLEIAGRTDVPVHPGCPRPLLRDLSSAQHVHGEDGMGDVGLPDPVRGPEPRHAVDVLLSLPRDHPGELTLVTLAPLTNIAAALLRDPLLFTRYRHVYCMAGAADAHGNISPTAEFNVWADPEAARVVTRAATPEKVTWIGWDVSRKDAVMTPEDQRSLERIGTPMAVFAHRINRTVADWARDVTGLAGYDLPDPVAMAVALRPDLITEQESVYVDIAVGDEVRGQMIVDRRAAAPAPNLRLVRRVDEAGFKRLLFDTVSRRVPAPDSPATRPGAVADGSVADGSVTGGSVTGGSVTDGSVTGGRVTAAPAVAPAATPLESSR
ncbi:nucleoside hydrolase [Streptomyces aureocirculatus]|uniref:nucleoside hydrolase n=1 Tax=Streptomyces aureocirculatus TaxID=67275 RepID=UPI00099B4958|nr:nucleoside hydrolase [Streptomyces aureocirculatus]